MTKTSQKVTQWVTNGPTVRSEYYPDAATTQLVAQHYQIEA